MMLLEKFLIHPRLIVESFKVCFARKLDQILIAGQVPGEQNQMVIIVVGKPAVLLGMTAPQCHIGFAPDDGLDACVFGLAIELDCPKHVAVVGHGDGRLTERLDLLHRAGSIWLAPSRRLYWVWRWR
jgi:hypothetical protein